MHLHRDEASLIQLSDLCLTGREYSRITHPKRYILLQEFYICFPNISMQLEMDDDDQIDAVLETVGGL